MPTNTTTTATKDLIVDKEDIIFEDFDDDLVIKYNNKNFLQQFSEDEKDNSHSKPSKYHASEKASEKTFVSLFQNAQTDTQFHL